MNHAKNVALHGLPQAGKSTILEKLSELLCENEIPYTGFLGKEIRTAVVRQGFQCVPIGCAAKKVRPFVLAHMNYTKSPAQVGKYGVDVEKFDSQCCDLMCFQDCKEHENENEKHVLIIDETGALECFSKKFTECVEKALDDPNTIVITSVSQNLFAQSLQSHPHTYLLQIDEHLAIREDIPGILLDFVYACLDDDKNPEEELETLQKAPQPTFVNQNEFNKKLVGEQTQGLGQGGGGGGGFGFGRGRGWGRGRGFGRGGGRGRGRGRGMGMQGRGRGGAGVPLQPGRSLSEVSSQLQQQVGATQSKSGQEDMKTDQRDSDKWQSQNQNQNQNQNQMGQTRSKLQEQGLQNQDQNRNELGQSSGSKIE